MIIGDTMNIKVVIVWAFAIVLFAGIGIFGYFNQNLLLIDDSKPYVPITDNDSESHTCRAVLPGGESIYLFQIRDNIIEKISITYKANAENLELYEAASNINQVISGEKLNGMSTVIYGGVSDFSLMVNVNPNEYDKARVESMSTDYEKLSMIIDSINDYQLYQQAISQIGNNYTCE